MSRLDETDDLTAVVSAARRSISLHATDRLCCLSCAGTADCRQLAWAREVIAAFGQVPAAGQPDRQ